MQHFTCVYLHTQNAVYTHLTSHGYLIAGQTWIPLIGAPCWDKDGAGSGISGISVGTCHGRHTGTNQNLSLYGLCPCMGPIQGQSLIWGGEGVNILSLQISVSVPIQEQTLIWGGELILQHFRYPSQSSYRDKDGGGGDKRDGLESKVLAVGNWLRDRACT